MKVQVSEAEGGKRRLEIEIPTEEVESAVQAAYKKYQGKTVLSGFRKGKVPLAIIKARFGKAIEAEVVEELISQTYKDAEQEQGIKPAGTAQIEEIDFAEGKPLRFRATVEVLPEIVLKEYKGLEVTRDILRVTETDVDEALASLRNNHAEVTSVEEEAREGHFLIADIQALDHSGIPIVNDKVDNAEIPLGKSPFGPEFDAALLGVRKGQDRAVKIIYPKNFHDHRWAGQERHFLVHVKEVKNVVFPELNDELAKTIGFQTVEELRQGVRAELERRAELSSQKSVRDHIVDHLMRENPIPAPEGMVNRFLDSFVEDMKNSSRDPFDEELLRNKSGSFAINQIRLHLILDEIKRREGIEGEQKEVLDYLVSMARVKDVEVVPEPDHPSLIVNP